MKLSAESLKNKQFWQDAGIALPRFDRTTMIETANQNPKWVHFGAGNIFRAFPAAIMQTLLEEGLENTGIIVAEGYDEEIIEKSFTPFDNLTILVTLKADGTAEKKVISSVASALKMDSDFLILKKIFASPSLEMASFTITEKGYSLTNSDGILFQDIKDDITNGHENPKSFLGCITALCYERYKSGSMPLALVSMDNCSHNGDILFNAVKTIAAHWVKNSKADTDFLNYICGKNKLSFPWTMIDKITPSPDDSVRDMLISCGLEDMQITITEKKTYIAPFVNAEDTQYLIIEDNFPNGRPVLEKAGGGSSRIIFTDKETVDKAEKMKVCTCLNPLHTALSFFGTLLGYSLVRDAMKDASLIKLLEGIGYTEGLPVATDPGIINPNEFLKEVMEVRLTNPFIPDTLYRIAMDSSLKIPIRFGETLKTYLKKGKNLSGLKYIPLVFAGWLRYLLGIDDQGNVYEVSPDPNFDSLKTALFGIKTGQKENIADSIEEKLMPILSNSAYFGVNLYEAGLCGKVLDYFSQLLDGRGAVRRVLSYI